jgi:hypothetical protein
LPASRRQIVSQIFVQGAKLAAERTRPDGSKRFLVSVASHRECLRQGDVRQEHFGWKAGIPAYAFADAWRRDGQFHQTLARYRSRAAASTEHN